jgi:hypothetical protein
MKRVRPEPGSLASLRREWSTPYIDNSSRRVVVLSTRPSFSTRRSGLQTSSSKRKQSARRYEPERLREAIALKRQMEEIVAQHTGQPLEKVSKDMERDYFMTAEEAKEYGLIDKVLARRLA